VITNHPSAADLILPPRNYVRWLSDDPAPRDLMQPFPSEPMRMWPISTRVSKPENDDPSIVEPIKLTAESFAQPFLSAAPNCRIETTPRRNRERTAATIGVEGRHRAGIIKSSNPIPRPLRPWWRQSGER
jgi:hypothetical protein